MADISVAYSAVSARSWEYRTPEQRHASVGVNEVPQTQAKSEAPKPAQSDAGSAAEDRPVRFHLTRFRQIKLQTTALYLIKDILPSSGLAVVWGPPKCGKSFKVADALLHVALGWNYRGHRVRQGVVVYCALEGAAGFRKRVEAFRLRFLADDPEADPPFHLMDQPLALVADHAAFVAAIRAQLGDIVKPAVVCIDTLNRSLTGSESSDEDMSAYIKAADAIRDAFDCLVVIVHHCGHDGARPRGHSSLIGAVDVQMAVRRDPAGHVFAELELSKDGPVGLILASRLATVEVGTDEDGDPITSCVIEPVDASIQAVTGTKTTAKKPISKADSLRKAFVDAYNHLATAVDPSPGFNKALVRKVKADAIRDELKDRGHLKLDDAGNLTGGGRNAFYEAKTSLFDKDHFVEKAGLIWQIKPIGPE